MFLKPVTLEGSLKHEDSFVCLMRLCLESTQLDIILEHEVTLVEVLVQEFQQIVSSHIAPLRNWFLQEKRQTALTYVFVKTTLDNTSKRHLKWNTTFRHLVLYDIPVLYATMVFKVTVATV
jgi:hypothetical protein